MEIRNEELEPEAAPATTSRRALLGARWPWVLIAASVLVGVVAWLRIARGADWYRPLFDAFK